MSGSCVRCGKCVKVCSFDAIRPEFTTRPAECAFCPDCAESCPANAIQFGWRMHGPSAAPAAEPPGLSRRAFVGASAVGAAAAFGMSSGALGGGSGKRLLRPPGSVREDLFLELCVRCGLCMKACPGPVLHPAGLEAGLDSLWTPVAVPSWAGCHQECNFCGQVCPTGAIRPLPIEAKRKTPMGLAVVNPKTCLPHSGKRDCQLCFEECRAAGYNAIEMRTIQLEVGDVPPGVMSAIELEEASRIEAPFVKAEACVGCGLCEYRCGAFWAKQKRVLAGSAIVVAPENEDRP